MDTRRLVAAALGAALLGANAGGAPPPARVERTPEFVRSVNDAIDKGVLWLLDAAGSDGTVTEWGGYPGGTTALAYHTLRVCGVRRDDPRLEPVWEAVKSEFHLARRQGHRTYSAALFAMAIAEHGDPLPRPVGERTTRLSASDETLMKEVVAFLVAAQTQSGTWSYGEFSDQRRRVGRYDHSNTQYALLGLKAAARCGVDVPSKTWKSALEHFVRTQERGGPKVPRFAAAAAEAGTTAPAIHDQARGWGYTAEDRPYGSMTAGAVGSIVICRSELLAGPGMLPSLDRSSEEAVRDGLAWLGANFTVRTNPGPGSMAGPGWHYYYLYAVERAGILAGVEWMADRDWYGEGAEFLVANQRPSGAWVQGAPRGAVEAGFGVADACVSTCFALLFLKKGTVPVRRGALTRAADDTDINFAAAARLTGQDFEDFVDLVLLRWRRSEDAASKGRLFDGATAVGPRIVLPLLARLDASEADERSAAHALLRHATGLDHGFDAAAPAAAREEAAALWHAWWLSRSDDLRYDPETRRLR